MERENSKFCRQRSDITGPTTALRQNRSSARRPRQKAPPNVFVRSAFAEKKTRLKVTLRRVKENPYVATQLHTTAEASPRLPLHQILAADTPPTNATVTGLFTPSPQQCAAAPLTGGSSQDQTSRKTLSPPLPTPSAAALAAAASASRSPPFFFPLSFLLLPEVEEEAEAPTPAPASRSEDGEEDEDDDGGPAERFPFHRPLRPPRACEFDPIVTVSFGSPASPPWLSLIHNGPT